jgi:hypothetical protein
MTEEGKQLEAADAADILLGENPTKDWTPEQRKEVEEIFKTLEPRPKPEPVNLRKHFKAGQVISDPQGLKIVISTVGSECMNVRLPGGKKGHFVNGYQLGIGQFVFVTNRSRKKETNLQLIGIQPPQDPEPPKEEEDGSTMPTGGNNAEA